MVKERRRILVDTDVLIECLRGSVFFSSSLLRLADEGYELCFSPISVAEVTSSVSGEEEGDVGRLFQAMECLPVSIQVGEQAGRLIHGLAKGQQVRLGSALIGATALCYRAVLLTLNAKFYPWDEVELQEAWRLGDATQYWERRPPRV